MLYQKLHRTWSHGYINYMPEFKEIFPELKNVPDEELADRFIRLGLDFYTEKEKKVRFCVRLTLPFALIIMTLMFIGLPINFMLTGRWGYRVNEKNYLLNWFKQLQLQ